MLLTERPVRIEGEVVPRRGLESSLGLQFKTYKPMCYENGNSLRSTHVPRSFQAGTDFEPPVTLSESYLEPLRKHVRKQACYMERSRRTAGKLVPSWSLVVPTAVLEPAWEEAG